MSDIKLVLTDLDGTVAEFGKHIVSDVVRESVIACGEKGIRMIPATGRYHREAWPILELLGFDDLGVFDNGATIQNCKTGEIIWSEWMKPGLIKQVAKIVLPFARVIDYTDAHDEHEPYDNEIETIDAIDRPMPYVYALIPPHQIETVKDLVAQVTGITYYTAPSTLESEPDLVGLNINYAKADKFHGVNALREMLGIPKEHTLAIGDGDNDIALFENAGIKVAMGNATDLLKEKADHIAPSVQEDGFAAAMYTHVLNK